MKQSQANAHFLIDAKQATLKDFFPAKLAVARAYGKRVVREKAPKKKRGK